MGGKKGYICALALAAALALLALASYAAYAGGAAAPYVLREAGGRIKAFAGSPGEPEIETDIEISGLREYDKQLLRRGIEVEGYENVAGLLEDFSN
ncbi:MAG: hypothetical protein LBD49_01630 [Oscillospiraceae bacterium]|nr:hypothetical protein [Oscillospiraceae bacterium]